MQKIEYFRSNYALDHIIFSSSVSSTERMFNNTITNHNYCDASISWDWSWLIMVIDFYIKTIYRFKKKVAKHLINRIIWVILFFFESIYRARIWFNSILSSNIKSFHAKKRLESNFIDSESNIMRNFAGSKVNSIHFVHGNQFFPLVLPYWFYDFVFVYFPMRFLLWPVIVIVVTTAELSTS